MPIITRKIELWINEEDTEKRKQVWRTLRQLSNDVFRAANLIVSNQYFNETFKQRIVWSDEKLNEERKRIQALIKIIYDKLKQSEDDEKTTKLQTELEKLNKKKGHLTLEARNEAEALYATGEKNSKYRILAEEFPDMPSHIRAPLNDQVTNKFKNDLLDVRRGLRAISSFRKGMPIPFMKDYLRFEQKGGEILLHWLDGMNFKLRFGRDRSNNQIIVSRILSGEYQFGDSQIQILDKKIFLLLVVKFDEEKPQLDSTITVGVDLGLNIPAYCALSEGFARLPIGNRNDFLRVRLQMQRRRKTMQRALVTTSGGKGRSKKLKALDALRDKERHFVRTYNHVVSRRIVEFAEKYRAGVIKLELLAGYGNDENGKPLKGDFILRNWSYFELQTMIEDKAKRKGMTVVYIDPYHTSQKCSVCGSEEEGQRISQAEFKCKNPECKKFDTVESADYNAALNIARSDKIVTKKEECEFFVQNKKQSSLK
ncbi:MAG: transposase [Bacteroidota bacterium]|jgi:IS605 OrfB family transposase